MIPCDLQTDWLANFLFECVAKDSNDTKTPVFLFFRNEQYGIARIWPLAVLIFTCPSMVISITQSSRGIPSSPLSRQNTLEI
jgi:hypothetical protein